MNEWSEGQLDIFIVSDHLRELPRELETFRNI